MTITEAFTRYCLELEAQGKTEKTRKNYKCAEHSLIQAIGDIPIELVSFDQITRWRLTMASQGFQSSTVKGYIGKLREVLKYYRRRGIPVIDSRDVELPRVIQRPPTWLDHSEVKQFLEVIESVRDKAIFASLWGTGARISELLQLNRDSIIDGQAPIIGKGDKPGILYFDDYSLKLLDDYLDSRHDTLTPLFISGQYRRITVSRVEQLAHIYADKAGIAKNVTPHVLRHSFASDMIINGAGIYDVKEQLRHSSVNTTQIYTHIREDFNRVNHDKFHTKLK